MSHIVIMFRLGKIFIGPVCCDNQGRNYSTFQCDIIYLVVFNFMMISNYLSNILSSEQPTKEWTHAREQQSTKARK